MNDPLLFGAIADDYTGGADLAGMLSEQGVKMVQILGSQPDELSRVSRDITAPLLSLR